MLTHTLTPICVIVFVCMCVCLCVCLCVRVYVFVCVYMCVCALYKTASGAESCLWPSAMVRLSPH